MKQKIGLWQLSGAALTALLGTLLHFLYNWLGKPTWIAPFSGVNESTFEHMKLLFWPMLLFAVLQSFFFREREDFWCIKTSGILLGLALIPILFYTYNGVIGKSPDFINIVIFFLSVAAGFLYETVRLWKKPTACMRKALAISLLTVIALSFVIFTFFTPKLEIFRDPISGTYGI